MTDPQRAALIAVMVQLSARGYLHGIDFGIQGIPGVVADNVPKLSWDGSRYVTSYVDYSGTTTSELASSAALDSTVARFTTEVAESWRRRSERGLEPVNESLSGDEILRSKVERGSLVPHENTDSPARRPPDPALIAVAMRCEDLGYQYGSDYFVQGVPGFCGSNATMLGMDDGLYACWYEERGTKAMIARSSNLAEVAEEFIYAIDDNNPVGGRRLARRSRRRQSAEEALQEIRRRRGLV